MVIQIVPAQLSGVGLSRFRSRDEEEVDGYAEAMNLVFESYGDIPLDENHIKQVHQILLKYSSKHARHRGEYKKLPNDVAAFEMVRAGGGAALAFNGNAYAVNAAEFVVVADNAWPVALLAAIFRRWGKEGLIELVTSSRAGHQKIVALPEAVVETIMAGLGGRNFNFYLATSGNREKIARESLAMRVKLRGEDVAGFG